MFKNAENKQKRPSSKKRRLISLILATAMILGLFPVSTLFADFSQLSGGGDYEVAETIGIISEADDGDADGLGNATDVPSALVTDPEPGLDPEPEPEPEPGLVENAGAGGDEGEDLDEGLGEGLDEGLNEGVTRNSSIDIDTAGSAGVDASIGVSIGISSSDEDDGGAALAPGDQYEVRFIVEGELFNTSYVNEGDFAPYPGAPPADMFPVGAVTFLGWYEEAYGNDNPHDFKTPIMDNKTFFARFSNDYIAQFLDGFDEIFISLFVPQNSLLIPPPPELLATMPVVPGSVFLYWAVDGVEPIVEFDFEGTIITSDITLRPIFADSIYVHFISYGTQVPSQPLKPGDLAVKPSPDPTRTNYTFIYWTTAPGGDGPEFDFDTPIYTDLVLYAAWSAIPNSAIYKVIWWLETPNLNTVPSPGRADHYDFAYSLTYRATPGDYVTVTTLPPYLLPDEPPINPLLSYDEGQATPTAITPRAVVNINDPLLYAEYQFSAATMISGANNSVVNVYLTRKTYRITFNLSDPSRWLRFNNSATQYYGRDYYIDVKYEQDITDIWPSTMTASFNPMMYGTQPVPFMAWSVPSGVNGNIDDMGILWMTRRNVMSSDMMPSNPAVAGYTLTAQYDTSIEDYHLKARYWVEPYIGQLDTLSADHPRRVFNGQTYILDYQYNQDNVTMLSSKGINGLNNVGIDYSETESSPGSADITNYLYQNFYYNRNRNNFIMDLDGAPGDNPIGVIMYGQPLSEYVFVPPNWEGYDFIGWYKDPDYTLLFNFSTAVGPANSPLTIFARWDARDYIIRFHDGDDYVGIQGVGEGETINFNNLTFGDIIYSIGFYAPGKGEFIGWYYYPPGSDTLQPYPLDAPIYGDLDLYAVWRREGFRVIYNIGEADPELSTLPVDANLYLLDTYARVLGGDIISSVGDEIFLGWRTNSYGALTFYPKSFLMINGDMVMYPYFAGSSSDIVYITFDNNYSTAPEQMVIPVGRGSDVPLPDETIFTDIPSGVDFLGWFVLPDDGTRYPTNYLYRIENAPVTLYAAWTNTVVPPTKYNVTYMSEGEVLEVIEVEEGDMLPPPQGTYMREGYTFVGWCRDAALTDLIFDAFPITENTTIYAKWELVVIPPTKYNVTYMSEGEVLEVIEVEEGDMLPPPQGTYRREGYTFVGWCRDAALTDLIFEVFPITENTNIYAKWELVVIPPTKYNVTYMSEGEVLEVIEVEEGDMLPPPQGTYRREGYTFVGWCRDAALTDLILEVFPITENTTIYAKWERVVIPPTKYTVLYVSDDEIIEVFEVEEGELLPPPRGTYVREGYIFMGWYLNDVLIDPFREAIFVFDDLFIIAKWEIIIPPTKYTVTYMSEGEVLEAIEVEEGDLLPAPSNEVYRREGYLFVAWFKDEALTDQLLEVFAVTEDVIIYAKWEKAITNFALAYINGPAVAYAGEGATARYTISLDCMYVINAIELEVEIDNDFYTPVDASAMGGFVAFGMGNYGTPIYWRADDNKLIGKVTLLDLNSANISGQFDVLSIVFGINEDVLGETSVKLNYIKLSSGTGVPVTVEIVKGEAITSIEEYFSPYDGNKDGVVDIHDLSYVLQYLLVQEGDPLWDMAKHFDYNDDGIITIEDLIILMANYTDPYYD